MTSPAHGASLCTTSGITAVITGVLAVSLLGQAPPPGAPGAALATAAVAALAAGATALYAARDALGEGLDRGEAAGDRALRSYHLGMAGLFAGLAFAAAWKLGLPHGGAGWAAALVPALGAARALTRSLRPGGPP